MESFVEVTFPHASISQLFQSKIIGIKKIFNHLTLSYINVSKKMIQSLADYVVNNCFWTHAISSKF